MTFKPVFLYKTFSYAEKNVDKNPGYDSEQLGNYKACMLETKSVFLHVSPHIIIFCAM